jgi:hypothetical protein
VITRKPGTVRILKENKFDKFTVPAGTLLYTLHNWGEGTTLFWFNGAPNKTVHKPSEFFR